MTANKIAIKATLKYTSQEELIEAMRPLISQRGLFIRTRTTRPVGSDVHFEFKLADGSITYAGDGVVRKEIPFVGGPSSQCAGMLVALRKINRQFKEVVDAVIGAQQKSDRDVTPNAMPAVKMPVAKTADADGQNHLIVNAKDSSDGLDLFGELDLDEGLDFLFSGIGKKEDEEDAPADNGFMRLKVVDSSSDRPTDKSLDEMTAIDVGEIEAETFDIIGSATEDLPEGISNFPINDIKLPSEDSESSNLDHTDVMNVPDIEAYAAAEEEREQAELSNATEDFSVHDLEAYMANSSAQAPAVPPTEDFSVNDIEALANKADTQDDTIPPTEDFSVHDIEALVALRDNAAESNNVDSIESDNADKNLAIDSALNAENSSSEAVSANSESSSNDFDTPFVTKDPLFERPSAEEPNSPFGGSTFGESSSAFGGSAFGESSSAFGGSAFGESSSAFGGSAFGESSSAFGGSAFGSSAFGSSTSGFASAFGADSDDSAEKSNSADSYQASRHQTLLGMPLSVIAEETSPERNTSISAEIEKVDAKSVDMGVVNEAASAIEAVEASPIEAASVNEIIPAIDAVDVNPFEAASANEIIPAIDAVDASAIEAASVNEIIPAIESVGASAIEAASVNEIIPAIESVVDSVNDAVSSQEAVPAIETSEAESVENSAEAVESSNPVQDNANNAEPDNGDLVDDFLNDLIGSAVPAPSIVEPESPSEIFESLRESILEENNRINDGHAQTVAGAIAEASVEAPEPAEVKFESLLFASEPESQNSAKSETLIDNLLSGKEETNEEIVKPASISEISNKISAKLPSGSLPHVNSRLAKIPTLDKKEEDSSLSLQALSGKSSSSVDQQKVQKKEDDLSLDNLIKQQERVNVSSKLNDSMANGIDLNAMPRKERKTFDNPSTSDEMPSRKKGFFGRLFGK